MLQKKSIKQYDYYSKINVNTSFASKAAKTRVSLRYAQKSA